MALEVLSSVCSKCRENKPRSEFSVDRSKSRGITYQCKSCRGVKNKIWRAGNKAHLNLYYIQNKNKFSDRDKVYKAKNREKLNAQQNARREKNPDFYRFRVNYWRERNKDYDAFRQRTRRALKEFAIPKWVDMEKISRFYAEAKRLTAETGIQHHVDHMVPLKSPYVCGLHVHDNLRVVPWIENLKKRNLWWPDMPRIEQ
jgi:hypothetical protein